MALSSDEWYIADFVQSLHRLTGIPLRKLQRYGTDNNLMNALEHPHALELTEHQLQKVEQLNAFLLSYRVLKWEEENAKHKITSPDLAGSYFSALLTGIRDRERFMVAFLDNANHIIESRTVSEGSIAEAPVYPRQILKAALNCDCASVILAHNHPGGSLTPSWEDVALTERMVAIFEPLHISVLDHIIIGDCGYASLAKLGQLPKAAEAPISYESITIKDMERAEKLGESSVSEPVCSMYDHHNEGEEPDEEEDWER